MLNIPFTDFLKEDCRGKEQEENSSFLERFLDLIYWWGSLSLRAFFFFIWGETKFILHLSSTLVSPDLNFFLKIKLILVDSFHHRTD